ncbi:serine hydrolase domain-containing protein [Streptomyces flavofungini]|uniref:serine hydrolase domain-containing protein n=1 Tax=Streptomyces flavofungini TaxID=68200 RepID=UPI0025B1FBDC|nr:serine hydrolase domain-containing protein [Streptomyces flavofungini]WJV49127.1 serine hydrolase domain-containing protein [Streptomyces flavofungini]
MLRPGSPESAGLDPDELRRLVHDVRALPEGPHPWCAGAVVLAGRGSVIAVEEATGWAVRYAGSGGSTAPGGSTDTTPVDLPPADRVPMRVGTPFDLASLTKLCTTVAAVQQLERGALALDAPVARYAPECTGAAAHGVTVRQLLTHTSGLRPELPLYELPDVRARLRALWAEVPSGEVGAYAYSDLNMLLLQQVLQRVTGRCLDLLIRDGITRPLGMTATGFGPCPGAAATEDQRRPWAKADRGMLRGEVHDENAWALGGVAGHAGLFGTARDLAVLCRTLLNGGAYGTARILGPDHVRLMLTAPGLGFGVDQAWFMGELAGRGAAGHTGFTGTSLVLDPATDTFLVLLANTVHPRRQPPDNGPRVRAATTLARAVAAGPSPGTARRPSGPAGH